MSVVHVSVKPSCMFCRCLAVDKIEECEEHGLNEEFSSDEEEKELKFTNDAKDDEDLSTWETSEKYGFFKHTKITHMKKKILCNLFEVVHNQKAFYFSIYDIDCDIINMFFKYVQ